jgi:hypothetical protein
VAMMSMMDEVQHSSESRQTATSYSLLQNERRFFPLFWHGRLFRKLQLQCGRCRFLHGFARPCETHGFLCLVACFFLNLGATNKTEPDIPGMFCWEPRWKPSRKRPYLRMRIALEVDPSAPAFSMNRAAVASRVPLLCRAHRPSTIME